MEERRKLSSPWDALCPVADIAQFVRMRPISKLG
jgi:hypothetical protein